jgi:alpha-1,6-mannosyltransferase
VRICDITQFYSPVSGGVKRYVSEKIRHLEARTEDSHLLIIPGERDERREEGRSVVCTIRSPLISRKSRYRALVRLSQIRKILERERPDIIECGDPYQVAWRTVKVGRALGIPTIGFYHSHFPEAYLRGAARWLGPKGATWSMDLSQRYVCSLYNRFERTLVPSPALAEVLARWGVRNVQVADLGVDTKIFKQIPDDRAATRAELCLPPVGERQLCVYIGRLAAEKNTRTLFQAFERLNREHPERFHLLVVGDGLQRGVVEKLRSETAQVTWLPYCDDSAQLARIYRCADLFVHPGLQETFGLVALESQACGTPVVGIRGSYMDRIIYGGQALWARENTPSALSEAILRTARGDLPAIGEATSRAVHARYSWDQVFSRLFGIYRTTIDAYKKANG